MPPSGAVWDDPERWEALKQAGSCPICTRGAPLDVVAELGTSWVTAAVEAPLPGYVCVVSKQHAVEPFELPMGTLVRFWQEAMLVARVLCELFEPAKMNYAIHGNTIPHLHMHLYPRFRGDPYASGPIDPRSCSFFRSPEDLKLMEHALASVPTEGW